MWILPVHFVHAHGNTLSYQVVSALTPGYVGRGHN